MSQTWKAVKFPPVPLVAAEVPPVPVEAEVRPVPVGDISRQMDARKLKMDRPGGNSTLNSSYENILQWWETKEPTYEISDSPDMGVEVEIAQLAAESEAVSWNIKEENVPMEDNPTEQDSDATLSMSDDEDENVRIEDMESEEEDKL